MCAEYCNAFFPNESCFSSSTIEYLLSLSSDYTNDFESHSLKFMIAKFVTLSVKSSLILGEYKAAFCREGHKYIPLFPAGPRFDSSLRTAQGSIIHCRFDIR